jgi:cytochrome c
MAADFPLGFQLEIRMKRHGLLLAAGLFVASGANAALDNKAADELMKKDGCAACHAVDKKIIGPAYQEVAAKYKGDAGAAAKLADKVKKGGTGVWGQIPMPPNAQVSDADIKNLVEWILTLKK